MGRSFNDIKFNLNVTGLDRMILEVIETLHLKECEVQDTSGRWYLLRIRPYRTKEKQDRGRGAGPV